MIEAGGRGAGAMLKDCASSTAPAAPGYSSRRVAWLITFESLRNDPEVLALIGMADRYLEAIGYTEHGVSHACRVAARARRIVTELGLGARNAELAAVCGLLHDVGNSIHRMHHAQLGATLAYGILRRLEMPFTECALVASAVGNHDEDGGEPASVPGAALILADKGDVTRSRVRKPGPHDEAAGIHDRVNYAVTDSKLLIDAEARLITLRLTIDTAVAPVMEYFEIFLGRMSMCRRAAKYLDCRFSLVVNETALL